jgi:hypothetical protein
MNYVVDLIENNPVDIGVAAAKSANGDEITLINSMLHVLIQIQTALQEQLRELGKDVKVNIGFAFKATLRSNQADAAEATDRTLKTIPVWPGFLLREELGTGAIAFDKSGDATVICLHHPDFLKRAIVNQGYVSAVK